MQKVAIDHKNDERKEVMQMLKIRSVNTFYKILRSGKLKGMQISGGIQVFWKTDIIEYLDSLQNELTT